MTMPDASKAAREAATEICETCGAWEEGRIPEVTVKLMSSIVDRHMQAERDAAEEMKNALDKLEAWSRDKNGGAPATCLECWTKDLNDAVCSGRLAVAAYEAARGGG